MDVNGFDESREDNDSEPVESLKKRMIELEEKLDQISLETGDGYHALRNQQRLKIYLEHLAEALEEQLDGSLPDPPRLEGLER